jgi:hypothetical protein
VAIHSSARAGANRTRQIGSRAVHSTGHDSVIAILLRDHDEVEHLFAELDASLGATDDRARHRRDIVDRVIAEVARHEFAEQSTVLPRVRELISANGAERLVREHAAL